MNRWIKSNFLSFYKHLKTSSFDRLPVLCPLDESTILNRDGTFMKVIQVSGMDYNGMSDEALFKLRQVRASLFARAQGIIVSYYVTRFRQPAALRKAEFNNEITQGIMDTWASSFDNVFVTKRFLAISTKTNVLSALSKLKSKNKKKKGLKRKSKRNVEKTGEAMSGSSLTRLNDYASLIVTSLSDYNPEILKDDKLYAFLASLINCQPYETVNKAEGNFTDWVISTPIEFTEIKNTFKYLTTGKVASFLSVKNFPEFAVQQFFDTLTRKNVEMVITHHCSLMDQDAAISKTQDKRRMLESFTKFNSMLIAPTIELLERLQANEVRLCDHAFSLQIISDDIESHKANINKIVKYMTQNGYVTSIELLNNEPLYYSQFPALRNSNVRKKRLTTDNLIDFISFCSSGTGNARSSFGDEPTAQFASVDGNIYNFIFQVSEASNALGHTLIIGDTGTGKTTLISFLLSCALRHKDMRIVAFDQLRGQEIATRTQYGDYVNFGDNSFTINPLLLDDTTPNKAFIVDFLSDLTDATDEEKAKIEDRVGDIFGWDDANRVLDQISHLFTQEGERLYQKLSVWQTGGIYQNYFNATKDTVSFDNPFTTFDFTDILGNHKILGLMTSYLTHVFFSQSDGTPRIIFVDELRRYLESDIFSTIIQRLLEEFRKLNGVFIGAIQNIDQLWQSTVGRRNLGNFGKFIIFPMTGNINMEAYMDGIGLNDNEISWLKTARPEDRQVLIKTKGGASTIVNVDLSYLGNYMKVFDSSAGNVRRLRELMRDYPDDFRERFLNS